MEPKSNEIRRIRVEDIQPNPLNPRRKISREEIESLAQNIKAVGLLQPITVRMKIETVDGLPEGDWYYEIVCGHRRFEACKVAGMTEIDCIVRELTDNEAYEIMVTENLQRVDVDPFDEAAAYGVLKSRGYDTETLAGKFGKSATYILSRIKLADLIPEFKDKFDLGVVDFSHCLVLARLSEPFQRKLLSRYADNAGWQSLVGKTVAELKRAVREIGYSLKGVHFDTARCNSCPKNTACGSLFLDMVEAVCEDADCYLENEVAAIMERFEDVRRRNPDFFIMDDYNIPGKSSSGLERRILDGLEKRGFAFVKGEANAYEDVKKSERYDTSDESIQGYSFGWKGFFGAKRAVQDSGTHQYKNDWCLNRLANARENELTERCRHAAYDRINAIGDGELLQRSEIELIPVLRAALYAMVSSVAYGAETEAFGIKDGMENAAEAIEKLDMLQLAHALAKFTAAQMADADGVEDDIFIMRLFREEFAGNEEAALKSYMDDARACWNGYGEVTDEMIEEDLAKRVKKEN